MNKQIGHGSSLCQDDMDLGTKGREGQPSTYSCHFCPRTFSTPQSIGGHQNAHKREKQAMRRKYMGDELSLATGHYKLKEEANECVLALEAPRSNKHTGVSLNNLKAMTAETRNIRKEHKSKECSKSVSEELDLTLRL